MRIAKVGRHMDLPNIWKMPELEIDARSKWFERDIYYHQSRLREERLQIFLMGPMRDSDVTYVNELKPASPYSTETMIFLRHIEGGKQLRLG